MANTVEFTAAADAGVEDILLSKLVEAYNTVVTGVEDYKAQGDVEEKADEILASYVADDSAEQGSIPFMLAKIAKAKEMVAQFNATIADTVKAEAQAAINPDFDADKARAEIKEARKEYTDIYNSVRDTFKMIGHVQDETVKDEESGKTSTELVASDRYGNVLLSVASAPNVRATKGGGSSTANSEGAKIRAWGKENGWPTISDRGPLPSELKDAYAAAN